MKRMGMAIVVLAVPFVVTFAGPPAAFAPDAVRLELSAGAGQAALLAQHIPFDARLQLATSLRAGAGLRFGHKLGLLAGIGIERANATTPSAGYGYPAWTGRVLWGSIDLGSASSPVGGRFSLTGTLAGYDSTFLVFVFPTLEAGPTIRLPLSPVLTVTIVVRIGWQMRQDLGLAARGAVIPGAFFAGIATESAVGVSRTALPEE